MQRIQRLPEWIWRAGPSLLILPIIVIHIGIKSIPGIDKALVNEIFGQLLSLGGGLVVLWSINEDFQDFRNRNMFSAIREYLKSCPLFLKHHVLDAEAGIYTTSFMSVNATVNHATRKVIKDFDEELNKIQKDTNEKIDKLRLEFYDLHGENKQGIIQVRNQLDKTIIGNVKYQIFGVLLIVYAFVVNICTLIISRCGGIN